MKPPVAEIRPFQVDAPFETDGVRQDPYHWLRASNWQEVMKDPEVLAPDIREYLEAENAYTDRVMADTAGLQSELFEEMKGRIREDDSSVPFPDGPYQYYVRYREGGQHPLYCRAPAARPGEETVYVDGDALAEGEAFFNIAGCEHSPDHALAFYAADVKGSEYFTLRFLDIETGQALPDVIADTSGNVEWAAGGRHVYYVKLDESHRPNRVYRHRLGTDQSADDLVYEEQNPGFYVDIAKSESGVFIIVNIHDHETSENWLLDAALPDAAPRLVAPRETQVRYSVSHRQDRLLILTNADGAEDFKIVSAPLSEPGRDHWRDLVPHRPGCLIKTFLLYKNHLVRLEQVDALPRIVVTALNSDGTPGKEHTVSFDEEAYDLRVAFGFEFDTATLRFIYSSPTTPRETFDYDMNARKRTLRKIQDVPSGHDPADYVTRRLHLEAHDGAAIPVTLLYRKSTRLGPDTPLLLYGYGSYGISTSAGFSTNRLSLVDRGFVYAIAHIRGGKDKGFHWYADGKLDKKKNTFRDFVSVARGLIGIEVTGPKRIVAHGGSAGGLLMGAVANMAPDCFGGVIADVPFVDVLNTICDATLPLTPPEWTEWGNPITNKGAYDYIKSYSPYDNVRAKAYPHILAVGGLTDPRVTYWEPAKWVAKLRAMRTDPGLTLLKINMEAGHGGAAGRFDYLKEVAFEYAFALKAGFHEPPFDQG